MNRLTPKQRTFCKHYIATQGNAPEAALRAYNCSNRNSARVMACKALKKPQVRQALKLSLLVNGLPEAAFKTLKEAMSATKMARFIGKGSAEWPHWEARLKAASCVLDLMVEVGRAELIEAALKKC